MLHQACPSPYARPNVPSGDARIPQVTWGQTQPPHYFGPMSHIPFATPTPAPATPAIVLVSRTPMEVDIVVLDHIKEPYTRRQKTWCN